MSGKNILITGASSGIGYTIALNLTKQEYQVFAGVSKENPRVKNLVGMDARFLNFVELYLPEWLFNSLIRALMIPKN